MTALVKQIFDEAMELPIDDRLHLIDNLLRSMHHASSELDSIWAAEAERRWQEIESGNVKMIPGEDVFRQIKEKYGT